MSIAVAVYVFANVEVLDFAGPFEVFTTASRVFARRNPGQPEPFKTFTVAKSSGTVRARAGLEVLPDFTFESCPAPGLLLIPGGVVDQELKDTAVVRWIAQTARAANITASVCTGAFLLARAGLLAGKSATTHWEDIADLRRSFPDITVKEHVRWVDEGAIVSSAGIAAGIDMSLHLVARLAGAELAQATARQMDVPYRGDA